MKNSNVPPKASPNKQPFVLDVDPGTLLAIVASLLLIPLLLSGFIFQ